jgi:hypothetical protein
MPEKKKDKAQQRKRKQRVEKEVSQSKNEDQPCGRKLECGQVEST